MTLISAPIFSVCLPLVKLMESESWKRLSFCVVGRKLRVPTAPMVVPSNGAFTFEMRGRSSAEPVKRKSLTRFELSSLVYWTVPL